MNDDLDTLALILHAARYQSRRSAKRALREAGGDGSAAELDAMLARIREHEQAGEIYARAEAFEAARMEADRRAKESPPEFPPWLIGETPGERSTWIAHFCPGGAESFIGRVFDQQAEHAPQGVEAWPLDEGMVLANICWMDGERPSPSRRHALAKEAARQLRLYDAGLGLHGGDVVG